MKALIAIKFDAGNKEGTGHFSESLLLKNGIYKISNKIEVIFISSSLHFVQQLEQKGEKAFLSPNDEDQDIFFTKELLSRHKASILICDQFERSSEYYNALAKDATYKILVILDHHRYQSLKVRNVVNFNICQEERWYCRDIHKPHLGPAYMILHPRLTAMKPIEIRSKVSEVLINSGGSDPFNLTTKIVRALRHTPNSTRFHVVAGSSMRKDHLAELRCAIHHAGNNFLFYHGLEHETMIDLIANMDMAITAAGNLLYELCFLGIPSLVICHHQRHQRVAEAFASRQAVVNLGVGYRLSQYAIRNAYIALSNDDKKRRSLAEAACRVVDGKGLERIISLIQNMIYE